VKLRVPDIEIAEAMDSGYLDVLTIIPVDEIVGKGILSLCLLVMSQTFFFDCCFSSLV
jgi:hypothetical protein